MCRCGGAIAAGQFFSAAWFAPWSPKYMGCHTPLQGMQVEVETRTLEEVDEILKIIK